MDCRLDKVAGPDVPPPTLSAEALKQLKQSARFLSKLDIGHVAAGLGASLPPLIQG